MLHPSKVLKKLDLIPRKSLSQNFLTNTNSLRGGEDYFVRDQPILEIGAGLGGVTEYFLQKGFRMIICEKDLKLVSYLRNTYENQFQIVPGDFLAISIDSWRKYSVSQCISNLPFHQTTDIMRYLLLKMPFIKRFLLGVQLEFGQRLLNTKKSSSLSVLTKALGNLKAHTRVKKANFFPEPKFDAYWIFWERNPLVKNVKHFEKLLRAAYWGKRKPLINALKRNPFIGTEDDHSSKWIERLQQTRDREILDMLKKRPDNLNHTHYIQLFDHFETKKVF